MNQTVAALNKLSIFGADQGGAYREHSADVRRVLGADIETTAGRYVEQWAASGASGVLVLTGNAGTGKTALAEQYCTAVGGGLPTEDLLREAAPSRWVVKDLSGVPGRDRPGVMRFAEQLAESGDGQLMICANEGVLRGLLDSGHGAVLAAPVEEALVGTAGQSEAITVLNMNRQRWTADGRWSEMLNYVVAEELWSSCAGCSVRNACPMAANAEALRRPGPRAAAQSIVRLASAEVVAPLREILTVLAHAVTGGLTCETVAEAVEEKGRSAYTAEYAYFNLLVGGRLDSRTSARSPLIRALGRIGIGQAADLQTDQWLREADEDEAPRAIQDVAGRSESGPLSQVRVGEGVTASFAALGRTLTIDSDEARVAAYSRNLLGPEGHLTLWRRKVFFEAASEVTHGGGPFARLSEFHSYGELLSAIDDLASGLVPEEVKTQVIRGLNFLSCGVLVGSELHVPDPGLLSARNPGSLLPAPPMVVHGSLPSEDLELVLESSSSFDEVIDHDDVRLLIRIREPEHQLPMTPTMFEILMAAGAYRAAPGLDAPEVADLRLFLARLAQEMKGSRQMRIARRGQDGLTVFKPPRIVRAT